MRPGFWAVAGIVLAVHLMLASGLGLVIRPSSVQGLPLRWSVRLPVPVPVPTQAQGGGTASGSDPAPRLPQRVAPGERSTTSGRGAKVADAPQMVSPESPPMPSAVGTAQAMPLAPPVPVRMYYQVQGQAKGVSYSARAQWLWQHDGEHYSASAELTGLPLLSRRQTSTGRMGVGGLEPLRYADRFRSEQAVHFEREKGQVVFSANRPAAVLQDGAQDRLSLVFQLAALLAGAPQRYPEGSSIWLPVVSPRDAEQWRFDVGALQTLSLPAGQTTAVPLTRQPQREYDPKLEVWLAPAQGYLPVRVRLTLANGDWVDQLWRYSEAP
jgi:hypothetical protein